MIGTFTWRCRGMTIGRAIPDFTITMCDPRVRSTSKPSCSNTRTRARQLTGDRRGIGDHGQADRHRFGELGGELRLACDGEPQFLQRLIQGAALVA